jgi:hypothetical protein
MPAAVAGAIRRFTVYGPAGCLAPCVPSRMHARDACDDDVHTLLLHTSRTRIPANKLPYGCTRMSAQPTELRLQ